MAELVLRLRDRQLQRVPILSARMTIGRDAASNLVIDNAGVSRTHAVVVYADNAYRVQDADSQNGITVNGRPARNRTLAYGDVIGIGKFEIELVESAHAPQGGGEYKPPAVRNVMRTLQMDASGAARLREEIEAKLAAKKSGARAPSASDADRRDLPMPSARAPARPTSPRPPAQPQATAARRPPSPVPPRRAPTPPLPPPPAATSERGATLKLAGLAALCVLILGGLTLVLLSR